MSAHEGKLEVADRYLDARLLTHSGRSSELIPLCDEIGPHCHSDSPVSINLNLGDIALA
jgi:hypothetical protein